MVQARSFTTSYMPKRLNAITNHSAINQSVMECFVERQFFLPGYIQIAAVMSG